MDAFWDALPEIFEWLHGEVVPVLAAMTMGANNPVIRDRIVGLPAGSPGQSLIETIRFAAANRLGAELDYRDQKGVRATRAIEAYSLRRSRAGDVLLMAVRADDGQARRYTVQNILGVTVTQRSFSPRYPIELSPTGPQSIPARSRAAGLPAIRSSSRRTSAFLAVSSGPTYVYRCTVCHKLFDRKTQDGTMRPHKNKAGYTCYGSYGTLVRTKY